MSTPNSATETPTITVGETTAGPASGPRPAGEAFTLPVEELLQGRGAVLGKSGSGKSNSVSVLVEELIAAEYPVLIFDADGEYVSLKEEYRILHVGGAEYCEQVIGPEHAAALADIGIEQREAIIVDLAGYAEHQADAGADAVTRDEMVAAITSAFFEQAGRAELDKSNRANTDRIDLTNATLQPMSSRQIAPSVGTFPPLVLPQEPSASRTPITPTMSRPTRRKSNSSSTAYGMTSWRAGGSATTASWASGWMPAISIPTHTSTSMTCPRFVYQESEVPSRGTAAPRWGIRVVTRSRWSR